VLVCILCTLLHMVVSCCFIYYVAVSEYCCAVAYCNCCVTWLFVVAYNLFDCVVSYGWFDFIWCMLFRMVVLCVFIEFCCRVNTMRVWFVPACVVPCGCVPLSILFVIVL